jgi:oxygen-independent coproporphyrinogen-3 oxidase
MTGFAAPVPLALYVHWPWCLSKCPYCDFNSYPIGHEGVPERAYVGALLADLEQDLPEVRDRPVESVFIGGGTPSLLSAEAVHRLLGELRSRLHFAAGLEITLEANPGAVSWRKFSEYRAAGVNRLSIGVQSFAADVLRRLGRSHNPDQARLAAEAVHRAGFDDFNLDLMVGLPGQTLQQASADIAAAVDLAPSHISYYQLTLEPNTPFHRHPPALPDEDEVWLMQHHGQAMLAEKGYVQYEVSAHARSGRRCRHNLNYWMFGDYLGIGAGAHGKLSDAGSGAIRRRWKLQNPWRYMKQAGARSGIGGDRFLQADDLPLEFMLNAMRLNDGVAVDLFTERTGLPWQVMMPALDRACTRGLLEITGQWMRPTALGWRFLNELLELFMPEPRPGTRRPVAGESG